MKKIALIFTLAFASVTGVYAQNQLAAKTEAVKVFENDIDVRAKMETDKLDKIVKLSDDQRRAVLEISKKLAMKEQDLERTAPDAKERYMKEIETARVNMYSTQLNADQMVLYKQSLQK